VTTHSFDSFLTSRLRNVWLYEPGIAIYVRKSVRVGVDIDLASMEADYPGKGALTKFLDTYEPHHVFCVENIHNPRLPAYLKRRGYLQLAGFEGAISMVSKNYWA
jgi:hypothetical protein